MPGMPEMMALLPGTAASCYELIYGPLGGMCLCCFVDNSAENKNEAILDANTLETWNDKFSDLLPVVILIFPPAYVPYLAYSYAINMFLYVHRQIAKHLPTGLPTEGDYPFTNPWVYFWPTLPCALADPTPIY